jgi:hypothetical protein
MFGIEFFWHAGSFGMPANLAVGDWISVQAHSSRVVRPTYIYGTSSGISVIEGEWISDLSPPIGFTLDSVSKFTAQVTSTATISWSFMGPDDCYASNLLSNDEFFRHMSEQRPAGYSIVHAEGRFEGGILIANKVWFCHE